MEISGGKDKIFLLNASQWIDLELVQLVRDVDAATNQFSLFGLRAHEVWSDKNHIHGDSTETFVMNSLNIRANKHLC